MLDTALIAPEKLRPLRRAEYDRLVQLGCFENERVELLHGMLVAMSPQGGLHVTVVGALTKALYGLVLAGRAELRVQAPFVAVDESEPEPDLALVPPGDYVEDHPSEAFLLIEVADSSLQKDRRIKSALYAASGVREYWLVDLQSERVEVHREPRAEGYLKVTAHGRDETLRPLAFPEVAVDLTAIWPR